jgi:hypothetical protein
MTDEEIRYLSDSVAYLLRTDLVKTNTCLYQQVIPSERKSPAIFGENGSQVRLMNNPKLITKDFELRNTGLYEQLHNCGAEWFRCYSATIHEGRFTDNLTNDGNSYSPVFTLADITAFLLDPTHLIDYSYTEKEMSGFERRLAKDFSEI